MMRIGVMEAGAVGCYFGGRLAGAGVPVTLVARPAHAEAIDPAVVYVAAEMRGPGALRHNEGGRLIVAPRSTTSTDSWSNEDRLTGFPLP